MNATAPKRAMRQYQVRHGGHDESQPVAVDLYTSRRASLLERLGRLAGTTTWRAPVGSFAQPADMHPVEHALAMACVWLRDHRKDATDISGDVLEALALQHSIHEDRMVDALLTGMRDVSAYVARECGKGNDGLHAGCARAALCQCITGRPHKPPPRASRMDWGLWEGLGARIIWAQADQGLRRAAEALV